VSSVRNPIVIVDKTPAIDAFKSFSLVMLIMIKTSMPSILF